MSANINMQPTLEQAQLLVDKMGIVDRQYLKAYVNRSIKGYQQERLKVYEQYGIDKKRLIEHISYVLGFDVLSPIRERKYTFARYILTDYLLAEMKKEHGREKASTIVAKIIGQTHASVIRAKAQYDNEVYLTAKGFGQALFNDLHKRITQAIKEFYA